MQQVISIALSSMQHDMARLDRVAMNLANAQTVGYKREVSASPFAQQLRRAQSQAMDAASAGLTVVDQQPASLRDTGQPLDLALAGPGWFEVQTEHGMAYTRQGDFQLDAQGRLATSAGHLVMGVAGEIQLPHGMPVIDAQGRVFEGARPGTAPARLDGVPLAQLKVVRLDAGAGMQRLGEGLVRIDGEAAPLDATQLQVRQGFLENSNVNAMQEMVQLIQTMRHFESVQKATVAYDEMVGAAIRRLGEPS